MDLKDRILARLQCPPPSRPGCLSLCLSIYLSICLSLSLFSLSLLSLSLPRSLTPHVLQATTFLKVQGAGTRVQGAGCRVQGAGCRG